MRSIIIFICLIVGLNIPSSKNYLDYHRSIKKAETYLVDNQPDSVFYYYDKAFKEFDFIFARDAFVAAQFAWKQKNKEKTIEYLVRGAGSGLKSSCIDESPVLKDFENTRDYEKLYFDMKQANARFAQMIDADLRDEWIAKNGEIALAADDEDGDKMRVVDRNMKRIRELIAAGKFPGENQIGLDDGCKEIGNYNVYNTLVNHDCVMTELHDGLWNAVKNGQLHPRDFAALWDSEVSAGKTCSSPKIKANGFNLLLLPVEASALQIDKLREQYCISSLETDRKKKQLEKEQGYVFFFGHK